MMRVSTSTKEITMRLVLVGADFEENLGMCMVAAGADSRGHQTTVVPFQASGDRPDVVAEVLAARPDVVGLAAQFQHRGTDFLSLARDLRRAGFGGHITAGGQFATMAHQHILGGRYGIDSVVLYEGEHTIGELLDALASGGSLDDVAGLALPDGLRARRTAPRPLVANLDALPLAQRYRQHARQLGVPFIPVSGGRGCWAACSFCSITTVLRDGREHGVGGHRLRLRSPESVGQEMAMLAQAVGGSAIFCFHDENFLLPRPEHSLARISAMKRVLDQQGIAPVAFVGKCRPDTVTRELAQALAKLGVVRMYVGVENASPKGALHLNRKTDVASMAMAVDAFADAGIFACYNLLIFEPEITLDDVAQNIAFMRTRPSTPVNFCRAEPYLGTPMYKRLQAQGKMRGGFLGWDYRIDDDRAELMFRMAASAFRERNFGADGVANRYMSLGYSTKLLDHFYKDSTGKVASLMERAQEITRSITLETADLLDEMLGVAARTDLADHEQLTRRTALFGLRIAAADRVWHAALDGIEKDMARFVRGEVQGARRPVRRGVRMVQGAAMAGWLALWATGSSACRSSLVADPLPPDAGRRDAGPDGFTSTDPVPADAGGRNDGPLVVDALPPDSGARKDGPLVVDALPPDSGPYRDARPEVDGLPPDVGPRDVRDGGTGDLPGDRLRPIDGDFDARGDLPVERPMVYDPLPPDAGREVPDARDAGKDGPPNIVDPPVMPSVALLFPDERPGRGSAAREHWTDTQPTRLKRSTDLPLCLCPEIRVSGRWHAGKVVAAVEGATGVFSVRWQSQGQVEGNGTEVAWTPSSDEDQLDVAVRTVDGVAVTLLRLEQVRGSKKA
jgi:anaerobic magnesium-protoporphyrin IX monomethyl ester cyclase